AVIKTDKQRIEQVLKNLLSNAFKFTPANGDVKIIFANRDQFDRKRIGISVKDSGIGIATEKQALIFEAFQQADGTTSRKYG
ncbi:ATP-binding protein, partial [Salmonella sp. E388-2]|uniref:ATP-binding protein n=1 Tax=Salmonella sp. E388-2 TaxID=3240321 RepID=UPI00352ADA8A